MQKCFDTEKRIRLGIWGLGRGSSFIKAANAVNIDIVAGCDYSEDLREKFRQACPDAFITADQKEFAQKHYATIPQNLKSWLRCATDLRNICAHYGRLYYRIFSAIPLRNILYGADSP